MPASSIAQILLRLFALKWLLTGGINFASSIFTGNQHGYYFLSLLPPIIYILAGLLFWFLSPKISLLLAKQNNGEVTLQGVTQEQLFASVLLGLGVFFALNSFANVFSWIHFFAINKSPNYGFHQENQPSYYELSEAAMTLVAGIALIFTSRKWAEKLCRKNTDDQQHDTVRPATHNVSKPE